MTEILKFHKPEELNFLQKRSPEALVDLCKLAFDYLKVGANIEKYQSFADSTGANVEIIQAVVESLLEFLIDSIRYKWKEEDLQHLITEYGLTNDQVSVLWQFILSKQEIVQGILKQSQVTDLRFRQLDWRLEARLASRSLHSQAVPLITIKLHLDSETSADKRDILNTENDSLTKKEIVLQTDPNCLVHIISQLEQALQESKSHRTKNFVKAFRQ